MTAATAPGAQIAPASQPGLMAWVAEAAELTTPAAIYWCDGSGEQWQRLTFADLAAALHADQAEWAQEIPQITEWFEEIGGELPAALWAELDILKARLHP